MLEILLASRTIILTVHWDKSHTAFCRLIHNTCSWLNFHNYCVDGENGHFQCFFFSFLFSLKPFPFCEAQQYFAANYSHFLWFYPLRWMTESGFCVSSCIPLWNTRSWLSQRCYPHMNCGTHIFNKNTCFFNVNYGFVWFLSRMGIYVTVSCFLPCCLAQSGAHIVNQSKSPQK